MNPLLLEYLQAEIQRAQLEPDSLTIYSKSHTEILTMDESMSGYEEIRNYILRALVNTNGDEGWRQYDRVPDYGMIPKWIDDQIAADRRFRQGGDNQ